MKMLNIGLQFFAHKKGYGFPPRTAVRFPRSKRLAPSALTGSLFWHGNILVRQRGTHIHPGTNVGIGSDDYPCLAKRQRCGAL